MQIDQPIRHNLQSFTILSVVVEQCLPRHVVPGCFPSMSPDDRFKPRLRPTRPLKTEISGDILQAVGECWEIKASVHERQKVRLVRHGSRRCRALGWAAMALAHAFQEHGLVAAIIDDPGIGQRGENGKKFRPYPLLSVRVVGPEAMFNGAVTGPDANSDQVVEIVIWNTFDIQKDLSAIRVVLREVDGMDLVFANGKCS